LNTSDKGPQSANALDVLGEFRSSFQYPPTKVTMACAPWVLGPFRVAGEGIYRDNHGVSVDEKFLIQSRATEELGETGQQGGTGGERDGSAELRAHPRPCAPATAIIPAGLR